MVIVLLLFIGSVKAVNKNNPTKRYGPRRREIPPRFQKTKEQTDRNLTSEHREADLSYKESKILTQEYPSRVSTSDKQEFSYVEKVYNDENTSPMESTRAEFGPEILAQIQEISPTKVNFLKLINEVNCAGFTISWYIIHLCEFCFYSLVGNT